MNIEGHHRVGEEVGLPVLTNAFKARGYERVPLNAFLLGNWLTDVQQFVDPVAITAAGIKDGIRSLVDETLETFYLRKDGKDVTETPVVNLSSVVKIVRARQKQLDTAIDFWLAPPEGQPNARRMRAFDSLRSICRLAGYFLFVHPTIPRQRAMWEPVSGPRMDPDAYLAVFDAMYTQYYPHDHLDRPQTQSSEEPVNYRSEIAVGPMTAGTSQTPDLYQYLREDIQIAALRLAEAERGWAQEHFDLCYPPRSRDPQWHIALACLGRAMHAVEDYFAHSNFVEQAISVLGDEVAPKDSIERETMALRLQRWQQMPGQPQPEEHIVSGTFDKRDTAISLLHGLTDFFGMRIVDPAKRRADLLAELRAVPDRADELLFEFQNFMYEVSELIADPQAAVLDLENSVAQVFRRKIPALGAGTLVGTRLVEQLSKDLPKSDIPFIKKLPEDWGMAALVNALVILHTVHEGYSVYQMIRDLVRVIQDPQAAIRRWCFSIMGDEVKDWMAFQTNKKIEDAIGARRIGCHSLLAKDHVEAALFEQSFNCAASVHWFVISTMTREPTSNVARQEPTERRNVDWLELLEFFLAHPAAALQPERRNDHFCGTVTHVVSDRRPIDNLVSLQQMYALTACNPGALTWRAIADANFGTTGLSETQTKKVINGVLVLKGSRAGRASGANRTFKPGTPILIPDQKLPAMVPAHELTQTTWWAEVLKYGTWRVLPGFPVPAEQRTRPPLDPYTPRFISNDAALARIALANQLLRRLEKEYS